ncbi:hypothetical protein [Brevifollis gellanilyticus]|uniref:Uncharacterized protein n=1 Tax=Brevifollis gellanilyticus TaxID=748831 RepID=A0A512MH28_9BACT|nr:hypothetical protein [Brevifollis gellanilyticus]GEP46038.1 hypothetical protein BGE01nite_53290 [Brevifollis gellanilyticus]
MPLGDLIGEAIGGFFRYGLGIFWEVICYPLGYWTLRLVTFGRYQPDLENHWCGLVGLVVFFSSIALVGLFFR